MSNEVRELKEHVRWLEDQQEWDNGIHASLNEIQDDVGNVHERLDKIYDVLESMRCVINQQSDAIKELTAGFNAIVRVINAQSQPAKPSFEQVSNGQPKQDRPKHPKRQKFKPAVVKNDQPDPPGAA
jgi:methyl-accepting chemotaxis protein